MTTKTTQKEFYTMAIEAVKDLDIKFTNKWDEEVTAADLIEFFDGRIVQLEKKTSKGGNSKTKEENEELASIVTAVLEEADKPLNMTDLLADTRIAEFPLKSGKAVSTPKLSAVIAPLVRDGKIVKTFEKKTPFYSLSVEAE
jgi:hypothetical protein